MAKTYNVADLINFYEIKLKENKDSVKSLAWGSRKSQEKRFRVLSQIAGLNGKSVIDVGCGIGDFYLWLKREKVKVNYTGVDISPSMVNFARKKYPKTKFYKQNILGFTRPRPKYDYALASGIFNKKIPNHKSFIHATIKRMFEICRKGVAFNIMSVKADCFNKEEFYADPGELLGFCMDLSKKAVLRHDYMPHDFTIYLYK